MRNHARLTLMREYDRRDPVRLRMPRYPNRRTRPNPLQVGGRSSAAVKALKYTYVILSHDVSEGGAHP